MSAQEQIRLENEVALMEVIIGLALSGAVIYTIVHLFGWWGLAAVWLLCALSSSTAMELHLPHGTDPKSKEERRYNIGFGSYLYLLFGLVATITLFYMWMAGSLYIDKPKEVALSKA